MKPLATQVRALGTTALAPLLALVTVFSTVGVASAAPTAAFTYGPTAPAVREPVTFRFTGTCDVEPCSIEWRWFQASGSTLGTTMGRGDVLTYAFPRAGSYTVRAKITNATSTHGSDFTSQSIDVTGTFEDNDRKVGYDGWTAALSSRASNGGYRVATDTSIGTEVAYRFTGTEVTYVANAGPNRGIALVTVAGRQQLVDLYAPTHGPKSFLVNGLTDAPHRIRVRPTGTKNEASTGTAVTVDGFVAGRPRSTTRPSPWSTTAGSGPANASASGGTIRNSATAGARVVRVLGSVRDVGQRHRPQPRDRERQRRRRRTGPDRRLLPDARLQGREHLQRVWARAGTSSGSPCPATATPAAPRTGSAATRSSSGRS